MPRIPDSIPEISLPSNPPPPAKPWIPSWGVAAITLVASAAILALAIYLHIKDIGPDKLPTGLAIATGVVLVVGFCYYKYRRYKEKSVPIAVEPEPVKDEPVPIKNEPKEAAPELVPPLDFDFSTPLPPPPLPPLPPPTPEEIQKQKLDAAQGLYKQKLDAVKGLMDKVSLDQEDLELFLELIKDKSLKLSDLKNQKFGDKTILGRIIEEAETRWSWYPQQYSAILEELITHQGLRPTANTSNDLLNKKIEGCLRKQQSRI